MGPISVELSDILTTDSIEPFALPCLFLQHGSERSVCFPDYFKKICTSAMTHCFSVGALWNYESFKLDCLPKPDLTGLHCECNVILN